MQTANAMAPKLVESKPARKPRAKSKPQAAGWKMPKLGLYHYAMAGVVVNALLSALLNGYANALHASVPAAGWGIGIIIPVIILILGKVASLLYKKGKSLDAACTGAVGVGLLGLSVWHCAQSIGLLTGSPSLLALPMAVAIDLGFVACEWAAIQAEN